MRARPDCFVAVTPVQHRPARQRDGGQVARGSSHQQRRCGLVTAHHQHHPVHRMGADGFFHVHRGEIAEHHRRRAHQCLAQRRHRKLHRKAACLIDAALHPLGQHPEVGIARRQLRPGIADADHRTAIEQVMRQPLVLHPAAMVKAVHALLAEPVFRPAFRCERVGPLLGLRLAAIDRFSSHDHSPRCNGERYRPPPCPSAAPARQRACRQSPPASS
jgi:hypothetical protein